METDVSRRDALALLGTGAATLAAMGVAHGAAPAGTASPAAAAAGPAASRRAAFMGGREPKPLPFDPAKLPGLSERLLRSHWENNYAGSVRTLNVVSERLAAAMKDPDLPPVIYGGLKREELHRVGSVVLHEHYFGNLGGDGRAAGAVRTAIDSAWGGFSNWEAEFRRTAMSLAGGSGWCVLTWQPYTGELRNQWSWDHLHAAIGAVPLLVLDMYEHSYHMDYGTAAAKYVDAFLANTQWEEVDRRFRAASAISA